MLHTSQVGIPLSCHIGWILGSRMDPNPDTERAMNHNDDSLLKFYDSLVNSKICRHEGTPRETGVPQNTVK